MTYRLFLVFAEKVEQEEGESICGHEVSKVKY